MSAHCGVDDCEECADPARERAESARFVAAGEPYFEEHEPNTEEDTRMDTKTEAKPATLPWWQDLNSDGVPDVRQGFFWNALWKGAVFVAGLVPQHTIYARTVNHAEGKRAELLK